MQVDYLVLADAASAPPDGKHYIHGGGWDTIVAAAFPVTHPLLAIALRLRVAWNDTNHPVNLEIDLVDADELSILPTPPGPMSGPLTVGRPPTVAPGSDIVVPLVFNMQGIQFQRPGTYAVVVRIDSLEAARSRFHIMQAPGGVPAPAAL